MDRPHFPSPPFATPTLAVWAIAGTVLLSGCGSVEQPAASLAPAAPHAYPESNTASPAPREVAEAPSPAPAPSPKPATQPAGAPSITAKCALLVDHHGRILFEKNAGMRVPAASTQKLLLGILIVERGGLSQTVTVAESDTWAEPTKMGIKAGEVYTREELLRAVLIRSSNDIARCLARDHSGSVSAFAAAMNQRARQLGMHDSYFTNASGLPTPPGQYSTARDLVRLTNAAMRHSFIRNAVATKALVFRFPDGRTKPVYNTNQVLRKFPYCTGAKTGYTNAAGRCLVSTASGNGRSVTSVILGSTTPNVWTESEALLRYGLGL